MGAKKKKIEINTEIEENGKQKKISKEIDSGKEDKEKNDDPLKVMEASLESMEQESKDSHDRFLRVSAEFENYKKRTRQEWELLINQANAELLTEILGILDDLDRAFEHSGDSIEHFRDGVVLIHSSLLDLLKRKKLREIEAAGKPFDPQYHEAVAEMNSENIEPGFVAEVIQKGYLLKDQVIRPAKVVVSKGSGQ